MSDGGEPLTERQRETLAAIRAMARTWSLETQARILWHRTMCRAYTGQDITALVGILKALDAVEGEVR